MTVWSASQKTALQTQYARLFSATGYGIVATLGLQRIATVLA